MKRLFPDSVDCDSEHVTRIANAARWKSRLAAVAGSLLLLCSTVVAQRADVTRAYKVKVAYLYNFTRYVKWPETAFEDAKAPFVIAVAGDDPFGHALDLLEKRNAAGRPIVVRRFESIDAFESAQIIFISRNSSPQARAELLARTAGTSVLVVGETTGFGVNGAGLNFFNDKDGTIGFEINVDAVKRRGLGIDAKLLSIARIVRDGRAPQS